VTSRSTSNLVSAVEPMKPLQLNGKAFGRRKEWQMRNMGLLALALLGLGACATGSSVMKDAGYRAQPDGLSCATRVVAPSIRAEYAWVRKYYPGAKVEMQALGKCDGAPADELYLRTPEGRHITVYFDISSFF